MTAFLWVAFFLAVCFAFYGGIILGISDCKRTFNIPKGFESHEIAWFTQDELNRLIDAVRFEYERNSD